MDIAVKIVVDYKIIGEIMGIVEISVIVYLSVLGFVAYKSRKKTIEELKK